MQDIMTFVVDILLAASFIIMIWLLFMSIAVRKIEQSVPRDLQQVNDDLESEMLIALTVEVVDNQYLCYNSRNMEFVCQGTNLEDIKTSFQQRYPGKNAAIYNGDESAVTTLRQQLKQLREGSNSIESVN
jgi:hypothetical protein